MIIMITSIILLLKAIYLVVKTKGYIATTYINKSNNEYKFNFNGNNNDIQQSVTIATVTSSSSEELVIDKVTSQEDAHDIQRIKSMITSNYVDNDYNNIHDYERQALYDLYISTNGYKWLWHYDEGHWNFTNPYVNPCNDSNSYNHNNYIQSNITEYTWQGLTCIYDKDLSYYYIVSINLGRYSLQGKVPDTIGNFNQLIMLELQENILTNTIPSTIGNLQELWNLYHSLIHSLCHPQFHSLYHITIYICSLYQSSISPTLYYSTIPLTILLTIHHSLYQSTLSLTISYHLYNAIMN